MPIQLDADLPAPLIPLAWLVGRWAGAGVAGKIAAEKRSLVVPIVCN